jgi:sigma-B regulation protein RsbU (phosphoserine phosphatase)
MSKKPKILILDDIELHRGLLGDGLEDYYEFDIERAESIESAESILQRFRPDLLLLDILMKNDNSKVIRWAEHLRKLPQYRDTPILFVTAQKEMKPYVEHLARTDFLAKPFTFEEVVGKIRGLLSLPQE